MKAPFREIISFALLVFGILLILNLFYVTSISYLELLGITFLIFAVPGIYFSLKKGYRLVIIISTVLFMLGVLFLAKQLFQLPDSREIYLTASLFITGSCLLMLFIENNEERSFLIAAVILFVLSILSAFLLKTSSLFALTVKADKLMLNLWPYLLVVAGMILLVNRKR